MTETDDNQSGVSGVVALEDETIVFVPLAEGLVNRMEKIAWEQDLSFEEVATACCRYGILRYVKALRLDEEDLS